jgi:tRNA(Arg) A34 adenosine deaminase TadA
MGVDASDEEFLRQAIALAAAAPGLGDRPFGSLLVGPDNTVLAEDHNRRATTGDVSAHPELKLAVWAARELDPATVAATTMYTSCEPCAMCAEAIAIAGLGRVVFALSEAQFEELAKPPARTAVRYDGPALFDEARRPIDAFFGAGWV